MSDQSAADAVLAAMTAQIEEIQSSTPSKRRSGPVMCEDCGNEWVDCTCDETGLSHHLFAFHGVTGGAYKVWKLEDTVFVQDEREQGTSTLIFLPEEMTRLAKMWLAMQEANGTTHEHVFTRTLDPRYEACSCGDARRISSEA